MSRRKVHSLINVRMPGHRTPPMVKEVRLTTIRRLKSIMVEDIDIAIGQVCHGLPLILSGAWRQADCSLCRGSKTGDIFLF